MERKFYELWQKVIAEAEGCPYVKDGECPILRKHKGSGDALFDCEGETSELSILSPREREVHFHLVKGKTNKMIAAELGISERTVEFHRANIMKKLQVSSLAELIEKTFGALWKDQS